MAEKELRKLKRRELLKMLLTQCEETERLQKELQEITADHEIMSESYERLKGKLNVKDERLNEKDALIASLKNTIEEMKVTRVIELEEAGNIAEAALRLNNIFETAQQAADQYLMNIKRIAKVPELIDVAQPEEEKQIPFEPGWRAGIRRKGNIPKSGGSRRRQMPEPDIESRIRPAASGDVHG